MSMEAMITANKGLVLKQLGKFYLAKDPEAESLAYEALMNAIRTYDKSKGFAFSTYATCCIYNALGTYVRSLNKKRQLEVVSYNVVAFTDEHGSHEMLESLPDFEHCPDNDILRRELIIKTREAINKVVDSMKNPKHKDVAMLWVDSECSMSVKEMADTLGISQSYVSQVIGIFKNKVKKEMEEYYYE